MSEATGITLTRLRERVGKTQAEVAADLGTEQTLISRHERGAVAVGKTWMRRYAEYYNVSMDVIDGREPIPPAIVTTETPAPLGAMPVGPTVQLPVIGTIRAGQPILAAEEVIGWESASMDTVRNGEHFYLKVSGDSMIGDHITPGSLVLVRMQPELEPTDIAVINVNGDEATLKRVRFVGDRAILIPSNPTHQAQEYPANDIRVVGKVVEVKIKF